MQKARYDLRKVICKNSSGIGYSSNVAKPGYWVVCRISETAAPTMGRVIGRIAESQNGAGVGHLAVMCLGMGGTFAMVRWVDPDLVLECYEKPPAQLLAWLTADDWVKNKDDIARLVAMNQHGSTSEQFIGNRNDPQNAYNARPEYVRQFIL